jgi:hypothetical protein
MTPDPTRHSHLTLLAFQSWLARGQPLGSPIIDWTVAHQKFSAELAELRVTPTPPNEPGHESLV